MPPANQRFVVAAPCPSRNILVTTHACMTYREFLRYRGTLFYWCRPCSRAHSATEEHLHIVTKG